MLREYETLFIMNPELPDDAVTSVLDRLKGVLTKMDAEVVREEAWGKRKLAFFVKKQQRGNLHLFHYLGRPGVVEELERTMRNLDTVLRYLTVGNGEVADVEARKSEIEKHAREAEARKAKAEAERKEREAARERGDDDDSDRDRGDRDRGDRDRGDRGDRDRGDRERSRDDSGEGDRDRNSDD